MCREDCDDDPRDSPISTEEERHTELHYLLSSDNQCYVHMYQPIEVVISLFKPESATGCVGGSRDTLCVGGSRDTLCVGGSRDPVETLSLTFKSILCKKERT